MNGSWLDAIVDRVCRDWIIAARREGALAKTRSGHAPQAQEAEIEPSRMPALQAAQEAGELPPASG